MAVIMRLVTPLCHTTLLGFIGGDNPRKPQFG